MEEHDIDEDAAEKVQKLIDEDWTKMMRRAGGRVVALSGNEYNSELAKKSIHCQIATKRDIF